MTAKDKAPVVQLPVNRTYQSRLSAEIETAIDRCQAEYSLSYADILGALACVTARWTARYLDLED